MNQFDQTTKRMEKAHSEGRIPIPGLDFRDGRNSTKKSLIEACQALQNIREYWNQDHNEMAMADACHYAVHKASEAIAALRANGDWPLEERDSDTAESLNEMNGV